MALKVSKYRAAKTKHKIQKQNIFKYCSHQRLSFPKWWKLFHADQNAEIREKERKRKTIKNSNKNMNDKWSKPQMKFSLSHLIFRMQQLDAILEVYLAFSLRLSLPLIVTYNNIQLQCHDIAAHTHSSVVYKWTKIRRFDDSWYTKCTSTFTFV